MSATRTALFPRSLPRSGRLLRRTPFVASPHFISIQKRRLFCILSAPQLQLRFLLNRITLALQLLSPVNPNHLHNCETCGPSHTSDGVKAPESESGGHLHATPSSTPFSPHFFRRHLQRTTARFSKTCARVVGSFTAHPHKPRDHGIRIHKNYKGPRQADLQRASQSHVGMPSAGYKIPTCA
jgi:hypothetical protein